MRRLPPSIVIPHTASVAFAICPFPSPSPVPQESIDGTMPLRRAVSNIGANPNRDADVSRRKRACGDVAGRYRRPSWATFCIAILGAPHARSYHCSHRGDGIRCGRQLRAWCAERRAHVLAHPVQQGERRPRDLRRDGSSTTGRSPHVRSRRSSAATRSHGLLVARCGAHRSNSQRDLVAAIGAITDPARMPIYASVGCFGSRPRPLEGRAAPGASVRL